MTQVKHRLHTWALVLAGGDGSRLQGLTRNVHGVVVPKQFCSMQGGASLLQEALQRAALVAPMQRVCTVVAAQHRHWWRSMLGNLRQDNVIVQPHNRGTAHGILLPLLRIVEMDPEAVVLVLPADHYVRDEETMMASLREASELAGANPKWIYLLGLEPIEQGALWNSFIMAASARTLLSLFDSSFETAIQSMQSLEGAPLEQAYQRLPVVDFSHDVLSRNEARLQVLAVPPCGWTDLGTPARVEMTLRRLFEDSIGPTLRPYFPTHLNLADQCSRLQRSRADGRSAGSADAYA